MISSFVEVIALFQASDQTAGKRPQDQLKRFSQALHDVFDRLFRFRYVFRQANLLRDFNHHVLGLLMLICSFEISIDFRARVGEGYQTPCSVTASANVAGDTIRMPSNAGAGKCRRLPVTR